MKKHIHPHRCLQRALCAALVVLALTTVPVPSAAAAGTLSDLLASGYGKPAANLTATVSGDLDDDLDSDLDGGLSSGGAAASLQEVGLTYVMMDEGSYQIFTFNLNTVVNSQFAQGVGASIVTDTPSAELNEVWALKQRTGYYFTLSPLHASGCFLTSQGYNNGLTLSRFVSDSSLWKAIRNSDGSITLQCKNGYVMDTTCGNIDQVGTRILSFTSNGFVQAQHYWFSRISEVSTLTPPTRVNAFSKTCAIMLDTNANKCVNIQYGAKNGGLAVVDTFSSELHECYNIVARANNLVSIHPLHATEYALSCQGPTSGQQIALEKYTGSDENLWEVYLFSNGTYGFRNYKAKLFLDNYCCDRTDGVKIIAYSFNGTAAQQVTLKDITANSSLIQANLGKVDFIKQRASTCKATSAAMAVNLIVGSNTYGTNSMIFSGVMCRNMNGEKYRGSDGSTYTVTYKTDTYAGSLGEVTNAVEKAVANGLPIVAAVHKSGGTKHHWVVITGKDSSGYLMVDPARSGSGTVAGNVKSMASLGYSFGLTDYSKTHYGYISFTKA